MKTFLQNHKWIGWLVFALGLIFSYLSSDTGAHVLLAAGGVVLLITHAGVIGSLLRDMRYDSGARKKALIVAAIGVVVVVFAVSNGFETDRRKDAAYAQRQSAASTAKYTYGFQPATGDTGLWVPAADTSDDYVSGYTAPQRTLCFACHGSGRCSLCNGTGTYHAYGFSSDCSCDDGVCSTCDGEHYI